MMKFELSSRVGRIFFAAFLALALPAAAQAKCLSKKETREAVQGGAAVPFSTVRGEINGEIVKARLCRNGKKYFYRVTVLTKKDKVKKIRLPATR